jgi:O-antigen ligase
MNKKNQGLSFLENFFTVLALFFYTGALLNLVLSGGQVQQSVQVEYDSSLIVLTFLIIYLITSLLLLVRWPQLLNILKDDYVVLPLLSIVFLSYFWSDAPELTLRRAISLLGTSLFGIYLASRYTIRQQLKLLAWSFGIAIVLSTLFALALPSYGVMSGLLEGAWRGVFLHKNGLGLTMSISATTFLLLAATSSSKRDKFLLFAGFIWSLFLLFMAQSGSAVGSFFVVVIALPTLSLLGIRNSLRLVPSLLFLFTLVFVVGFFIFNNLDTALSSIGEDSSLTGRAEFWPLIVDAIRERPFLGYGFEAFWRGLSGASASLHYAFPKPPVHAHNGLLQLWLSVGFLGVTVFLAGFWLTLIRALTHIRYGETLEDRYWPISFLIIFILSNIAESNVAEHNDLQWVLFIAVALSLSKQIKEKHFSSMSKA